jgi:hypothetical protein
MARTVTGTVTLEISPIGNQWDVRMWVGAESVRVKEVSATMEEAQVWAGMFRGRLREYTIAEVIIIERPIPEIPAGLQPDLYHVKP